MERGHWPIIVSEEFTEWFDLLPSELRLAITRKISALRLLGPDLRRPHADTLKDSKHANMKELRVDEAGQVIRIAFAFDPKRRAVVLCGGAKQGLSKKKFYSALIRRADRIYDVHLKGL
jgi:hypothetical protein